MQQFSVMLKDSGLRATPRREEVMRVLSEASEPLSVEAVVERLVLKMDTVTVYRTLETLTKAGLTKQVDFREGKYRYELNDHHHHHLLCTECKSVTPLYDECIAVDAKQIQARFGFEIVDHALEFFGRCKQCAQKALARR